MSTTAISSRDNFLGQLEKRYEDIEKLPHSRSLYDVANGSVRIYIRYSRLHSNGITFFGLRRKDLDRLREKVGFLCFLREKNELPLLIPFVDFEDIFASTTPATDGQYKVQLIPGPDALDFYIAQAGRFNAEGYVGWHALDTAVDAASISSIPDLSHSQVQSLLGAIGHKQGYDIWFPASDRASIDQTLVEQFSQQHTLPIAYTDVGMILQEVDVIWFQRGRPVISALFEVEHSTPIYSGLLRFNDIHLLLPTADTRFNIVARESRRSLYARQIARPTFVSSGLDRKCAFLEYRNVYAWYQRVMAYV